MAVLLGHCVVEGVAPNYRRFNQQDIRNVVNCPECKEKLKSESNISNP